MSWQCPQSLSIWLVSPPCCNARPTRWDEIWPNEPEGWTSNCYIWIWCACVQGCKSAYVCQLLVSGKVIYISLHSLAQHTNTVPTSLLKKCPDVFGFVSCFVACRAISCDCSCMAMSPSLWWTTWPVGGWTFCWQMSMTRGLGGWRRRTRRLRGRRDWKHIPKVIVITRRAIWWGAGWRWQLRWFMNGGQLGPPRSRSTPTIWGDQEWIIGASWIAGGYNLGGRLVLPLMTRSLRSDRISSRSPIIICTVNIISFRTQNCESACLEFEMLASVASHLRRQWVPLLQQHWHYEWYLSEWPSEEFVGWCSELDGALFFCWTAGKTLVFMGYTMYKQEAQVPVSQLMTSLQQYGAECRNTCTIHLIAI